MNKGDKVFYEESNYCTFGIIICIKKSNFNNYYNTAYIRCNGITGMMVNCGISTPISYKIALLNQLIKIEEKKSVLTLF